MLLYSIIVVIHFAAGLTIFAVRRDNHVLGDLTVTGDWLQS